MKVLVVVDMQNDFVSGNLGTKEAVAIVPDVKKKIEEYYNNGDVVFFTKDTHLDGYLDTQEGKKLPVEHCVIGTNGWEIVDELKSCAKHVINKDRFGSNYLAECIHGGFASNDYDSVELVGVCTDICVVSNALLIKAWVPEMEITVDASCCAGVTPEKHRAALEVMKSCQINVIGEKSYDKN